MLSNPQLSRLQERCLVPVPVYGVLADDKGFIYYNAEVLIIVQNSPGTN